MGGTGAGGGAVKKGAASSSKRARHSLSEEGSGRVPAESSDAEPCESSQDSLQAFDRVLNDPINGAEDEEIEDSVIFRTKQDVSWEEKAVDLASQLRTELKINYWQIQVGRRRRVSVFWEGDGVSNKGVVVKTCALKGIRVLYDIDKQTHWEDPGCWTRMISMKGIEGRVWRMNRKLRHSYKIWLMIANASKRICPNYSRALH